MKRTGRVGTVVIVAVVAGGALHVAGSGSLAAPPMRSWVALEQWYEAAGPGAAIVAMVRLAAVVAATWLAMAGGLQLLAPLAQSPGLQRLADSISPRVLRSLAQGAAGLSVTAAMVAPSPLVAPVGEPPGTAVMVPLDVGPAPTTTAPTTTALITTTTVPTTTVPTTTTTTTVEPAPTSPATPVAIPVPDPPAAPVAEIVVAPGDSFWSIAVDEAAGRELVAYWRALIDANLDRLVDPSNPDLLYPDQVLRLP